MADAVEAILEGEGSLRLDIKVGDGIFADWTVKLWQGGKAVQTWKGQTDTGDPVVELPSAGLVGSTLEWLVVLFGAAEPRGYSMAVMLKQGDRALLRPPIRCQGTVQARRTATEHGRIELKGSP